MTPSKQTAERQPIAVFGAGSWGTALAILAARNGRPVRLWDRDPARAAAMQQARENSRYLSEIRFPATLTVTADLAQALLGAPDILIAVPSHAFRGLLEALAPLLGPQVRVAWATKGLNSGRLLHEVVGEVLGTERPVAVVSGPTFAREVALGYPTAVTVASPQPEVAEHFAQLLHDSTFRAYTTRDVAGVELGGAVKNALALAAGIADGLGFGANTRSALITRGLAEMMRLGVALGGQPETFMGLAGLGDLLLTCTDNQSRNRRVGLALGRGESLEAAIASVNQVVEGVTAAPEVRSLARAHGVEMPIIEQVCEVLLNGVAPQAAVEALLSREQKPETA